ncbi:MAG: hypothetical protein A2104_04640 [Candidatus Melainabacteria bacterium GWF2_32_7]|nr:MAG: hypothetical protein A2104_04640 [Candidatus Melainabacteria bacterium GWF2_32_7]
MKCPRCKEENAENAVVCVNCKLKLKSACPRCKALNKIGQSVCSNCNLRLIRFCPQCKSPNFPNAPVCRKCNFELLKAKKRPSQEMPTEQQSTPQAKPAAPVKVQENVAAVTETQASKQAEQPKAAQVQQTEKPAKTNIQEFSRAEAHDTIINVLNKAEQGFIIDLSAQDGAGKSTLVSSVIQSMQSKEFSWLIGTCQPINQLLPYSFFQDLFKSILGLPLFVSNIDESRVALNQILETNFGINDPHINNVLRRFLFNAFNECSPDTKENRDEIHNVINYVLDTINQNSNLVIIIEDFEYIDNASLECLKSLINKGFLNKKNFIIINHNLNTNLHEQFPLENLQKKIILISLKSMPLEEMNASLLGMLNNQDIIPANIKNKIFYCSKDVPLYMEQALWYLFQTGAIISKENTFSFNPQAVNIEIPANLDELIAARIKLINNFSPDATRIIMMASLFGIKFIPTFVQMLAQVEEQQYNQLMQMLMNNGIFAPVDQFCVRFKHTWIWKVIYEQFFTEEQVIDCGARLLEFYEKYTTNISNAILARHAEEAQLKKETYIYYNLAVQESIYLGDPVTFTDYQNKILELLPETDLSDEQKNERKLNIEEQIGKVNYEFNPQIAIDYLSNSILHEEKQNNLVKVIDLTGYLARSCELIGDFAGVIECCDKALSLIDKVKYPTEIILLNYYKLESTFNLGRFEETIINATNEVLPALEKYITKNKTIPGISISDLKNIEYETEIILAKSYVYQGNKQALELTANIALKAQKENLAEYELHALLLQALFSTIQGNSKACNSILTSIKEKFADIQTPDKFKLYWYFIAVISNMTNGDFKQAKEFCHTSIAMANIFKEFNMLTILKLFLGKCHEEFGQFREAFLIYDEIVNYCSENKMATGALLSWYLAASYEVRSGNQEKAVEIAERAIEIAQKPNISNYLAEIFMNKIIANVRTGKNDFEGAQINIETAVNIAERNDLTMCLVELYIVFGQLYNKSAVVNPEQTSNNVNISNRLFVKALSFAEQIENHYLIAKVDKEILEINKFCQQSGIKLENIY